MNWNKNLDRWSYENNSGLIFGLRVLLGFVLLVKGFLFMSHINELSEVLNQMGMQQLNKTLALVIAWSHLLGGLAIMTGLLVRISCVIQFPILLGAVFYSSVQHGFLPTSEFMLSITTLYLIIFFFVNGAGKLSLQYLFEGRDGEDAIPSSTAE